MGVKAIATTVAGKPARIVIVDYHPIVRERLAEVIQREPDLVVCGEAAARAPAFQLIQQLKPDLAIVDLTLQNSNGLELLKDLHAACPQIRLLVVSMHDESLYAERVIRAGAHGYITKQAATQHMLTAIRRVLAGDLYLNPATASRLVARLAGTPALAPAEPSSLLSDRELRVLEMTGRGFATKQMAQDLGIDVKTVETYRARIKQKLGLRDATELLQFAIRWANEREALD